MADIIVDTYKLNVYAQRVATVNGRIKRLDQRINALYMRVGLWNLIQAEALTGYSWRLLQCQSYLQQTALDFEGTEKLILGQDILKFMPEKTSVGNKTQSYNKSFSDNEESFWETLVEEAKSVGEFLSWIEKEYEKYPHWITHSIDVLVPESLQEAYIITSGMLQGNLTFEEGWEVAKSVLSNNTKLSVICETFDYAFKKGAERSEEMERQMEEQLREGDILGVTFDLAEGFVDTIIGGSVDVLGDVAGTAVDNLIDKTRIIKGINKVVEYGTGVLGCNDGDGYSIGGLIGETAEVVSEGIDIVTDVITDTTDIVTDAVTDGIKTGVKWVTSWFD